MTDPFSLINRALERGTPKGFAPKGRAKAKAGQRRLNPANPKDAEYLRRMYPDFDEIMGSAMQLEYKTMCQTDACFANKFVIPPVLEAAKSFREHTNSVDAVCWTPEQDAFVSASHDSTLKVWDCKTGACKQTLSGHVAGVYHCAMAKNGRVLASCGSGAEKNALLWSWPEKRVAAQLRGHKRSVTHMAFSSDSASASTVDQEGCVCVHDVARGTPKVQVAPHLGVCHGSSFCPEDPNMLCSVGGDGTVLLLDLREQVIPPAWRLPSMAANAVVLHPPRLCVGMHDGHDVYAVEFLDRKTIITGGGDNKMKRWDLRTSGKGRPKCGGEYLGHTLSVRSLSVSPDQRFIVSGCEDGSLRIWPRDPLGDVKGSMKEIRAQVKDLEASIQDEASADVMKGHQLKKDYLEQKLPNLKADQERLVRDGYIPALRMLNGHTGLASCSAWKDDPVSGCASILSASWDQSVQLFSIDMRELG